MRVVATADYQGRAPEIDPKLMPEGDMLICAGDLAGWGSLTELGAFNNWLGGLDYRYIILVLGNHDQAGRQIDGRSFFTNATHYLQDELVEIEGLKIYGSPINEMNSLRLNWDWAFCDPNYIKRAAEAIPSDLDILVTHGGPLGYLDKLKDGRHVGSVDIRAAIDREKPRYSIFGHIHESRGILKTKHTTFINASLCDERNDLFDYDGNFLQPPQVIVI